MIESTSKEALRDTDRENTLHATTTTIGLGDGSSISIGSGGPYQPFGHQVRLGMHVPDDGESDRHFYLTDHAVIALLDYLSARRSEVLELNRRSSRPQ